MVTKYTAAQVCDRIETTGQQIKYVLASDYAALEAERDELKRRLGRVARELRACHDERALAIAEGRDNG